MSWANPASGGTLLALHLGLTARAYGLCAQRWLWRAREFVTSSIPPESWNSSSTQPQTKQKMGKRCFQRIVIFTSSFPELCTIYQDMNSNQKKGSKGNRGQGSHPRVKRIPSFLPPTGRVFFHLGSCALKECRF